MAQAVGTNQQSEEQAEYAESFRDLQVRAPLADPPQMARVTWEESHRVKEHLQDPEKNIVCTPPAVGPQEQRHLDSLLDVEDLSNFTQMDIPRNFDESHVRSLIEKFTGGKELSKEQVQALQNGLTRFLEFAFQASNAPFLTVNIIGMSDEKNDHAFERSRHRDRYLDLPAQALEVTTHWSITGSSLEYVRNEDIRRDKLNESEAKVYRLNSRIRTAKFPFWRRRLERKLAAHLKDPIHLKKSFRTHCVDDGCMSAFRGKNLELHRKQTPDTNSLIHLGGQGRRIVIVGIPCSEAKISSFSDVS